MTIQSVNKRKVIFFKKNELAIITKKSLVFFPLSLLCNKILIVLMVLNDYTNYGECILKGTSVDRNSSYGLSKHFLLPLLYGYSPL